jgi:hypothetical protein
MTLADMVEQLREYTMTGKKPCVLLQEFLSGNVWACFTSCTLEEGQAIGPLVEFVWHNMPVAAFGSKTAEKAWNTAAELVKTKKAKAAREIHIAHVTPPTVPPSDDLDMPFGLSKDGVVAYKVLRKFLHTRGLEHTGGCRAFFSPEEWAKRGESFGLKSCLVVCHDGGDLAQAFNLDYCAHQLHGKLNDEMAKEGFFVEQCTAWYSAVYKLDKGDKTDKTDKEA